MDKDLQPEIVLSESLFRDLVEYGLDFVWLIDQAGRFLYASPSTTHQLGHTVESLIGHEVFDFIHADDQGSVRDAIAAVVAGQPASAEGRFRHADGTWRELSGTGRPLPGDVATAGIVVNLRDVTERKETELKLSASRDLLRTILEHIPVRVFWKDKELRYLGCNTLFAQDAGMSTPDDLIGKDDFEMAWREQAELYRADDAATMDQNTPKLSYEEPQTRPDGGTGWLRTSKVPLHEPDGNVFGMLGIYEDVTERKEIEDALRHSETTLSEAQRIARIGSWELDHGTQKLTWSDEVYRIFELEREQFDESYDAFLAAVHPDDRAAIDGAYAEHLRNRAPYDIEHRLLLKDGRIKYVQERIETFFEGDRPLRSVGTTQDITERRLAEISLADLNRALTVLSDGNKLLVHAGDEATLLQDMCRTIVEKGGYRLCWVGFVEHDAGKSIRPVTHAGFDEGYLESLQLTWEDNEQGQGPTGRAVRLAAPQICRNVQTDPSFRPWRKLAQERGYSATMSLPLKRKDGEVFAVINIYAGEAREFDDREIQLLEELADDLAFGVLTIRDRERHTEVEAHRLELEQQLERALMQAIASISRAVEMRDPYTAGHEREVSRLARMIAQEMGLPAEECEGIRVAGLLHDIGKLQVPMEILSRPTKLTPLEYEIVKTHAETGYNILKDIEFPWPVAEMVRQHHERLDGSGYPRGLHGDEMLLGARILAVADTLEAMGNHRPYRPSRGINAALLHLLQQRGELYDPAVVDACLKLFSEEGLAPSEP